MQTPARLPGPPSLPLLGNMLDLDRNFIRTLEREWHDHGDVFRLQFFTRTVVIIADPDDVAHVLHNREGAYSRDIYQRVGRLVGDGLLAAEGDAWRQARRTLQPLFARKRMARLVPDFTASADELVDRWAGRHRIANLTAEMSWVTLRAVTRTLFAWDMPEELDALCECVSVIAQAANARLFFPELFTRMPTRANRRYDQAIARIDARIYARIGEARASGEGDGTLLRALLDARDPETGEALSDTQIRDELITMFVAGHETTALLLTWAFHRLSEHPAWLRAVQAEIRTVLGEEPPTPETLRGLELSARFLQEVARLHPPVWGIPRAAARDDALPSGHVVPAGSMVALSPYLSHRHPDHWDNPEGFDPDRFLPERSRRHPCAYYPFGRASRMCIGREFALLESLTILARVLQRCTPVLERRGVPSAAGTLRPEGDVGVRLQWE